MILPWMSYAKEAGCFTAKYAITAERNFWLPDRMVGFAARSAMTLISGKSRRSINIL